MSNIAIILAGGIGSRMGNVNLPKQFLKIGDIPIIIMTLQNILKTKLFDKTIIAIHKDWVDFLKELLNRFKIDSSKINIVIGGKERLDSIENVLYKIKNNTNKDDIVVICDAARPFITKDMLNNSIIKAQQYDVAIATIPAKDTMVISENNIVIDIPNRNNMFNVQTPESFKFGLLYDAMKTLTAQERQSITCSSQICEKKGIPIHSFSGDERNIKITTMIDLYLANIIYEEMKKMK
ncbi:2-C-methyl-D-erythritol 4-phosphate cytidylyltransferase [bacterium]|nr:2-C-methyl-D-erythritol 4-phosphate cytidylyltransferase [bacterium]